ncbi:MAG TPA: hypothetical protein EYG31_07135 [Porticoccaceae bacterium]|jgi:hypothetical protein|nr:hypothetical protein [Gammaproteobacteria bacterium]HIL60396.1 hypothetical protein [Porticoccaceae bacterium]
MNSIPSVEIYALNNSQSSENKIHSDEIAEKFGFKGALVSGMNVFGYLSQPLVKHFGPDWLSHRILDVKFLKPAYQGDLVRIDSEIIKTSQIQNTVVSKAFNQTGALLALLESSSPAPMPSIDNLAYAEGSIETHDRREIEWDLIHLQQPSYDFAWQPTAEDNKLRVDIQRDTSEIFRGPSSYIHPFYIGEACNKSLMRMFILPAWIHTASRIILRKSLKIKDKITIKTVPIQKWEKRKHQFIKLYVAMIVNNEVAVEVEHSAIFKIAQ